MMAAILVFGFVIYGMSRLSAPNILQDDVRFIIEDGEGFAETASHLENDNIIEDVLILRLYARIKGVDRGLQAGEYLFEPHLSSLDILDIMLEGKVVTHLVTIAEGLTVTEILDILSDNEILEGEIDANNRPLEGSLLAETYYFNYGDSRVSIIERMAEEMQNLKEELWASRARNLPFDTWQEAVTLASIIEKETSLPEERARISGVFVNRLRQGMRLQADPTVIYAVTEGLYNLDRPISRADLNLDSPYNTYIYRGLPPSPIANVGRESIEAALHPETNDYLYFVADGSGGHVFARTLEEHNHNVAAWRRREN